MAVFLNKMFLILTNWIPFHKHFFYIFRNLFRCIIAQIAKNLNGENEYDQCGGFMDYVECDVSVECVGSSSENKGGKGTV